MHLLLLKNSGVMRALYLVLWNTMLRRAAGACMGPCKVQEKQLTQDQAKGGKLNRKTRASGGHRNSVVAGVLAGVATLDDRTSVYFGGAQPQRANTLPEHKLTKSTG